MTEPASSIGASVTVVAVMPRSASPSATAWRVGRPPGEPRIRCVSAARAHSDEESGGRTDRQVHAQSHDPGHATHEQQPAPDEAQPMPQMR